MLFDKQRQGLSHTPGSAGEGSGPAPFLNRRELITPNPKLKLLDQVREVMRLKHYSIRTETAYCDWIKRYVKFHGMKSRADLQPAESQMELFLSDLAVRGKVAASTQNQAFIRKSEHRTLNSQPPTSN